MRCNNTRCHYNDNCFCSQPDYATIDKDGVCEQMLVKKQSLTEKYEQLKTASNTAYTQFNENPTEANSTLYGIAIEKLRDFCCEVVATMVERRPDLSDNIWLEED